jgi:EpsI family protein
MTHAWQVLSRGTRDLPDGSTVRETHLRSRGGGDKLVWQWYLVQGRAVSSGYMAKLLNAWSALKGDPGVSAVVIATDVRGTVDTTQAAADLTRFLSAARPVLERAVSSTASQSIGNVEAATRPE